MTTRTAALQFMMDMETLSSKIPITMPETLQKQVMHLAISPILVMTAKDRLLP